MFSLKSALADKTDLERELSQAQHQCRNAENEANRKQENIQQLETERAELQRLLSRDKELERTQLESMKAELYKEREEKENMRKDLNKFEKTKFDVNLDKNMLTGELEKVRENVKLAMNRAIMTSFDGFRRKINN